MGSRLGYSEGAVEIMMLSEARRRHHSYLSLVSGAGKRGDGGGSSAIRARFTGHQPPITGHLTFRFHEIAPIPGPKVYRRHENTVAELRLRKSPRTAPDIADRASCEARHLGLPKSEVIVIVLKAHLI